MQWVGRALSSVSQYYKEINPATLTGAIDVIVVERPRRSSANNKGKEKERASEPNNNTNSDTGKGKGRQVDGGNGKTVAVEGEDDGIELACSPFHVRFGKLSVLRPVDKKVRLTVNEEPCPFYMKVTETGEAYFVFETHSSEDGSPVGPDGKGDNIMLTSPVLSAAEDEGEEDVEEMDIGASDTRQGKNGEESNQRREEESNRGKEGSKKRFDEPDFLDLDAERPPEVEKEILKSAGAVPDSDVETDPSSPDLSSAEDTAASRSTAPTSRDENSTFERPPDESETTIPSKPQLSPLKPSSELPKDSNASVPSTPSTAVSPANFLTGPPYNAAVRGLNRSASASKRLGNLVLSAGKPGGKPRRRMSKSEGAQDELEADEQQDNNASSEINELEKRMSDDMDAINLNDDPEAQRERLERNSVMSALGPGSTPLAETPSEIEEPQFENEGRSSTSTVRVGPPGRPMLVKRHSESLMLDTEGYKLSEDESARAKVEAAALTDGMNTPSAQGISDLEGDDELLDFTKALLQSSDRSRDIKPSGPSKSPGLETHPEEDESSNENAEKTEPNAIPFPSSSPPRQQPPPQDPYQFVLLSRDNSPFQFELAICDASFGKLDYETFKPHRLSRLTFLKDEKPMEDKNLVVYFGGRFLTWENASTVLVSLGIYRKSLIESDALQQEESASARQAVPPQRKVSSWTRWWSRSKSEANLPSKQPPTEAPRIPSPEPPASPKSLPLPASPPQPNPDDFELPVDKTSGADTLTPFPEKQYAMTLRLTSEQLKQLDLKPGPNKITFSVRSSYSGEAMCSAQIFLWPHDAQIVVSDIDGTITKSDALGHVLTMIGKDWTHPGVAKLYTDIVKNGYKIMYLTSRAIGQADTTREYLKGINQNKFQLPEGPVIMSPDRLMTSLHREVIMRKPEVFKMACLRDIQNLFHDRKAFYAGFGNRITDALSYRSVDVPSSKIFTIDYNGEVKMELLELAGYKSSYIHMTDLVDQMFPPITKNKMKIEYSDFNFWRPPIPDIELPDLSPPSPALSARSGNSYIRLPKISLSRGSSQRTGIKTAPTSGAATPHQGTASRAASPGAESRSIFPSVGPERRHRHRSASPLSYEHNQFTERDYALSATPKSWDESLWRRDRSSARSDSMPGSLPGSPMLEPTEYPEADDEESQLTTAGGYKRRVSGDDTDEDEDEDEEEEDGEEEEELVPPEDDFLETGEMDFSSVPYL